MSGINFRDYGYLYVAMALKRRLSSICSIGYQTFGKRSVVFRPLCIVKKKHICIGDNVTLLPGARIEAIDEWNNKRYYPKLEIDSDVTIGQGLHLTCANYVHIGLGCVITSNILITDIEHCACPGMSVAETNIDVGSVIIGNNVFIGAGSKILGGNSVIIGDNAVIGAGAIVTKDVPANCKVVGAPARVVSVYDFELDEWKKVNEGEYK